MIHFRLLADWVPLCWLTKRDEECQTTIEYKEVTCPKCIEILVG